MEPLYKKRTLTDREQEQIHRPLPLRGLPSLLAVLTHQGVSLDETCLPRLDILLDRLILLKHTRMSQKKGDGGLCL